MSYKINVFSVQINRGGMKNLHYSIAELPDGYGGKIYRVFQERRKLRLIGGGDYINLEHAIWALCSHLRLTFGKSFMISDLNGSNGKDL